MKVVDTETVAKLMDLESRRRKVLMNNLANLNTPGYRAGRVSFKEALSDTLADGKFDEDLETTIERPRFAGDDGKTNNVELGREVVELNKNSMRTETYLAYLKFRKKQSLMAIRGQ